MFLKNRPSASASQLSETEMVELIHELEVHQVELEMQNEELMKARSAAADSAEKYTSLYEFAPAGYLTISPDGRIHEINLRGTQMLGSDRSHLQNSFFDIHVSKETKSIFNQFLNRVFDKQENESCDVALTTNGSIPVYAQLTGVLAENGVNCLLTAVDITKRRHAEERACQLAAIVQSSEDAIIGKNLGGMITSWNKGAEKIYGYTELEMIGRPVSILTPAGNDDEVPALLERIKSGQVIQHYETSRRRKDGSEIQVSLTISPIFDSEGRIIAASTIARDITGRKQAEQTLHESRQELVHTISQLALAQQTGHVGSWNFDLRTNKLSGSAEAQRLFGLFDRDNSFDLQHIEDCIPDRERVHQALTDLIANGTPYDLEYVINPADGSEPRVIISKATIGKDSAGNPVSVNGIVQDITENKLISEKLLSQTTLLEAQLNSTLDGILIVGRDNRRILLNRRMIELFNVPADIAEDKDDSRLLKHVMDLTKNPGRFLERIIYLNDHPDKESSDEIEFADGMVIDRYSAPVAGRDGKSFGRIWIFRDITERKLADSLFRDIIEKNPISIQILNMDGYTIQTNPAHTKLFGVTTPANYSIFKDTQLLNQGLGVLFDKVKEGETVNFPDSKFNVHDVDPSFPDVMAWIKAVGFTLQNKNGVPHRVVLMHENITERKHAEALFHDIIEKNPMSIQIVDKNGYTLNGNPAYTNLFGSLPPPGFSIFEDLQRKSPELGKLISLARQGEVVHLPDIYYNTKDVDPDLPDKPVWIRALLFPLNDTSGKPERYVFMHENITERKLAEQELIKTMERAEESDRLKSAFLANMSHEIRTPMNGILGFAGLLKEPGLKGEEQQKYIRIIEKSGTRMLNIINDIVDISKIESGQMEVALSAVNVNSVTDYLYAFFKPEAETKGIRLILENSLPAKEAVIISDKNKFDSILTNLIKNAIKYTFAGSIEFGYHFVGTPHQPFLQFFVKDTGIGIPEERQEVIFERFIQADISDTQAYQGAGLGLAIAKAYVEMLGGKIRVESEYGKGSVFYFSIPYITGNQAINTFVNAISTENPDTRVAKLKILIADDDETSDLFIETLISPFSREVLHAETGTEAVRLFGSNPDIDLVMMDMKMPGMNGYEATRQIRQFNTDVIIIAQTAYGLSGDREKALEAGCNDYISKPIAREELLGLIQKHSNKV